MSVGGGSARALAPMAVEISGATIRDTGEFAFKHDIVPRVGSMLRIKEVAAKRKLSSAAAGGEGAPVSSKTRWRAVAAAVASGRVRALPSRWRSATNAASKPAPAPGRSGLSQRAGQLVARWHTQVRGLWRQRRPGWRRF